MYHTMHYLNGCCYHIKMIYYTPCKQPVCPSVCVCNRVRFRSFLWRNIEILTSQNRKIAYNPRACHGNWIRSMSIEGKMHYSAQFIFFYSKRLEVVIAHKNCLWPESVSGFWPKVIWASLRSLFKKCLLPVFVIN